MLRESINPERGNVKNPKEVRVFRTEAQTGGEGQDSDRGESTSVK